MVSLPSLWCRSPPSGDAPAGAGHHRLVTPGGVTEDGHHASKHRKKPAERRQHPPRVTWPMQIPAQLSRDVGTVKIINLVNTLTVEIN